MFSYKILLLFLVSFGFISSFMVVFSKNPIFSILFLILSFCDVSLILFLLEIEYLPLMFLIIYVGAIAVLFLFVIMMLNLKVAELKENSLNFFPIIVVFFSLFFLQINIFLQANFSSCSYSLTNILSNDLLFSFSNDIYFFQKLSNLRSIGFLIFSEYYLLLIIASLVLLVGMISSISLTLQKKFLLRNQNVSSQVLRDYNKQIVLYN